MFKALDFILSPEIEERKTSKYCHQNTFQVGNPLFVKMFHWSELRHCALSRGGKTLVRLLQISPLHLQSTRSYKIDYIHTSVEKDTAHHARAPWEECKKAAHQTCKGHYSEEHGQRHFWASRIEDKQRT